MRSNKILNIISAFLLTVQAAVEALFAAVILQLNMLPDRYVIALIAGLVLLLVITGGLLFLRGKKPVSLARRIVGWVLILVVIAGCLIGAKFAKQAYDTLNKVTVTPQDEEEDEFDGICVFVREEDAAQSLADAAQYPFGIIAEHDEELLAKAIQLLETQLGSALTVTSCESAAQLMDALLNDEVDAILVNSAVVVAMSEEEGYEDLLEKIRVLHGVPMSQLEGVEPTEPPTEPPASITQEPFAVYLSGSDTRSKKLKKGRSDVNILAIVNPQTKQILLINTPRDYYVANPAGKGKMDKLTNCGLYGTENTMKILSNLYGVDVNYYAQINFTGVETLVDAIGGITVNSTETFKCGVSREYQIVKGLNKLDGKAALAFARERKLVSGGDNGRGKNQMRVITAIIQKATTGTTIISNYSQILASLEGMFRTSMATEDMSALVKMQLNDMASWNIKSFAVTGEGGSEKTYSSPGRKAYVMHPHKYMVNHAAKLAEMVISGQTLTDADMKVTK